MQAEQIYQQLIELAEKLRITVSEKNLRQAGLRVRSGLCKVHGDAIYVMDKKTRIDKKVELLAECLAQQPLDEFYVVPAVREAIEKHRQQQPPREQANDNVETGNEEGAEGSQNGRAEREAGTAPD